MTVINQINQLPPLLKKILKVTGIAIAALLLLLAGTGLYLHHWLNKQLPGILNRAPDRKYDIRYKDFSINVGLRRLTINGISIIPVHHAADTTAQDSTGIEAAIDRLVIDQVRLRKLFFAKEIHTGHLSVLHPVVKLNVVPGAKTPRDSMQVKQFLQDFFDRIRVNNIDLQQGSLTINDRRQSAPILELPLFNIRLQEVIADSATVTSPFPFRYHAVGIKGQSAVYHLNPYYTLNVAAYSLQGGDLVLDTVELKPIYTKTAFQQQIRYQQDWFHLLAGKIIVRRAAWGFSSDKLFVQTRSLQVNNADFYIYRDKRTPYPPFQKKPLVASFIKSLPFLLSVDSLEMADSRITYEEHPEADRSSGKVIFDKLSATGLNVCNDPSRLQHQPLLDLKATSKFMGVSPLKAHFIFQLAKPGDEFSVTGNLGAVPSAELNKPLKPLAAVSASGQIHSLDFTIKGDDISALSTMRLLYDSLSLDIFQKEGGAKNWLLTAAANIFVRRHHMPGDDEQLGTTFRFARYQNRSFFNYLWQCIKRGALFTMMDTRNSKFRKKQVDKLLQKSAPKSG